MKQCKTCKREFSKEEDFLNHTSRWRVCSSEHLWFNCECGSTLVVIKDKYPWYSPEKALKGDAKSIFNKIPKLRGLPRLDTKIMQIQELLSKPDFEPRDLEKQIREEPFLTAEVIKAGGDAKKFRTGQRGNHEMSLLHSINYLGPPALKEIVLGSGLQALEIPESKFDKDAFWRTSYLSANIASFLSHKSQLKVEPDSAYIAGLFANIGKLAMALTQIEEVNRICEIIEDPKRSKNWEAIEAELGLFHHTVIGEIAASLWGLPVYCVPAIRHHHDPKVQSYSYADLDISLIKIVRVANQFALWMNLQPELLDEELLQASILDLMVPGNISIDSLANEISSYLNQDHSNS